MLDLKMVSGAEQRGRFGVRREFVFAGRIIKLGHVVAAAGVGTHLVETPRTEEEVGAVVALAEQSRVLGRADEPILAGGRAVENGGVVLPVVRPIGVHVVEKLDLMLVSGAGQPGISGGAYEFVVAGRIVKLGHVAAAEGVDGHRVETFRTVEEAGAVVA